VSTREKGKERAIGKESERVDARSVHNRKRTWKGEKQKETQQGWKL
jgi:hypothetical protein